MSYNISKIITDVNGKQYYETDYGSYKEESNQDVYVITEFGDRLDQIAQQFYGSSFDWYLIAEANNLNNINVEAGLRIRIPPK